jgi:polyphosphate kinase
MELTRLNRPSLKDPPYRPRVVDGLGPDDDPFATIRSGDVLLYHPYDSFNPVVDFIRTAAEDPDVLAIKQTLYRVGTNSPVVEALMAARESGKQVAVLVELKARFDEENNIVWARALERAGVHVVYGLLGLKTHAKMCLVVRREADGIRRYAHLGTGNYNPVTARVYSDLGMFTTDREITSDVSDLFNAITGYSRQETYRRLLVAPTGLREGILARVDREIDHQQQGRGGHIAMKMNSLVDPACIQALYRASQAGVKVDLQVRGICCLRPGLENVSDNITVTSVVGRFLEHARIFWFANGGDDDLLLGSADLMPRNLDGRVEVVFPVLAPELRREVRDDILRTHLEDTAKARRLRADGTWTRVQPSGDEPPLDSQARIIERRRAAATDPVIVPLADRG